MTRTILEVAITLLFLIQIKDGTADESQKYKYGDIIAFQRKNVIKYSHFGIYIDKLRFKEAGQMEGDNLFHITKKNIETAVCGFSSIEKENTSAAEIFNYLDAYANQIDKVKVGTEEDFTKRIWDKIKNCPPYRLFSQNCEHAATYIRYGVSICIQLGQTGEGGCKDHGVLTAAEKKMIREKYRDAGGDDRRPYSQVATASFKTKWKSFLNTLGVKIPSKVVKTDARSEKLHFENILILHPCRQNDIEFRSGKLCLQKSEQKDPV